MVDCILFLSVGFVNIDSASLGRFVSYKHFKRWIFVGRLALLPV